MPRRTYCESVYTRACTRRLSARSALMTASSLHAVVGGRRFGAREFALAPALISIAAHPPGPGLPRQAPSV